MKEIADFNTRYMNFYQSERNSKNVMDIPRLKYVVLSVGCGKLHKDTNKIEYIVDEIANIAGQRAVKSKIKLVMFCSFNVFKASLNSSTVLSANLLILMYPIPGAAM